MTKTLLQPISLDRRVTNHVVIDNVADGYEALVLARLLAGNETGQPLVFVVRDGQRLQMLEQGLAFAAPGIPVITLPGWDCLPYDRVSPSAGAAARRLAALAQLAELRDKPQTLLVLTTANAVLQRMPPADAIRDLGFFARVGSQIPMEKIVERLEANGFDRVSTVRDVGEYAVRGGILDLFAPGAESALRLDFFGDTLESVRSFDTASQRTVAQMETVSLNPMSEVVLSPASVSRFRRAYIDAFGAPKRDDALYQAISEQRRFAGMEHWLPLFYDRLETLHDYLPDALFVHDHLLGEAVRERRKLVEDHYAARKAQMAGTTGSEATPYHPVQPDSLYLSQQEIESASDRRMVVELSAYAVPDTSDRMVISAGSRPGRSFADVRAERDANVFDHVVRHIAEQRSSGKKIAVAGWSEGSLDRLRQILEEHGLERLKPVETIGNLARLDKGEAGLAILPLEQGFETEALVVVSEQDVLGDRLVRRSGRKRKASDFISEVAGLSHGDIVVHVDHGIGRFAGLRTIEAAGAPHDCLELHYQNDDRLFLPVENIELLSRYGGESATVVLDRLGGGAWQARKAKLKKRLLDMAGQLIRIAAERAMRGAPKFVPADGLYGEFAARFPYEETEDQQSAIDAVIEDLAKGQPMDRLICGDVGFGKTEVALRAAFVAAMEGVQVAIVVPTTLLARQHFKTFRERFAGLPLNVEMASRLVPAKQLAENKKGLETGSVDIIVGTHALLGASVKFKNLGLLIIDEEQHFGVKHKERLKELKSDVHVLTLSATPIPRTLQLSLSGVRELSLITTAPADRMAVRTFVSPIDPLVIRETLLRERYRGGQSFYVVPRIADLDDIRTFLREHVPELRVGMAHGQMPPGELDDIMNAFYDGQYDVLLSTTIVESGLDIPTANTLIVHRADMFGLAQLYQLRGRVGRSKARAYALFTLPANRKINDFADRRLKVLQSLDTLGAGFQLASHDLDIRGAGNLLGDAQSGHIKEVGYELYQQMLEEAVAELRGTELVHDQSWSPQITVGIAVMIPEFYVPDLTLRLGLYRRLGELETPTAIDGFGAEMIDRFGPMPEEVEHLLKIVYIKALCRRANVERLDAGPKGVVISFRNKEFADPVSLVGWIAKQGAQAKIRPDQSIVLMRDWPKPEKRLNGAAVLMTQLVRLLDAGEKAA
jgi:transcription-repair coupling factor (superfamily II helicase)